MVTALRGCEATTYEKRDGYVCGKPAIERDLPGGRRRYLLCDEHFVVFTKPEAQRT